MFKILNRNREVVGLITSPINPVIDDNLVGMNELRFSVPASQEGLELEGYIRIENEHEYVIKEISTHGHNREVIAIMNVEELIGKVWTTFRSIDMYPTDCIREIVAGTGWTVVDNCPPNKRRNLYGTQISSWDLIFLACDVWGIEVKFDTHNKVITTQEKRGTDRGTYFMSDLNLKQLMHDSHTHKLITRVIPIGKDGLTIESVNGGKNYISNHSYSNKVITGIWQSDRYTKAEDLKEDATKYLEEMCIPYESYECNVSDLYRLEGNPNFEFNVGDVIYLIDNITKKKIQQRIIKHTKNLTSPDKDTINLANKSMSFTDYYKRLQLISNMTEQAIGSDGLISNGSIESVDADKIVGEIKANSLDVDTIISEHIKAEQILAGHIKADQIYGEHIVSDEIDTRHLKADSIKTNHISAGQINAGHIQAGAIQSGHIDVGSVNAGHIQTGSITAGSGIIADGAIGSAQISSLDANKINAGEIDTSKVKIKGENGFLFIENNTLYVVDNNKKIRCELGVIENNSKSNTNYGFVVRGADGQTIMLDHNGVHNAGITDGAIDNRKVSENANISGKKLDIDSVIKTINEDGSVTIQGTKVQVGNTTLDVKLSEQNNLITEQGQRLDTQQSEITANTNAIKLKVDNQTYTADKNEINTKLNKATSDISVMKGQIALKVEQTDIENAVDELEGTVDQKIKDAKAEIKVTTDSISQRVSSNESTTSTLSTKVTTIEGTANTANSNATNALNKANTATTTANSASSNATSALNKANSAIEKADDAKDTADTAIETAEGANTTAGNALSTANTASQKVVAVEKEVTSTKSKVATLETNLDSITQRVSSNETTTSTLTTTIESVKTTANNANTNASNALDKANTASTNASNAVTTANKANTTASTASTNATTALNTANSANTLANTANNTANTNKNNITTLQTTVTTTNNKVAELTTNLDGITQRVSSTESTVSSHTTQLGTVDSRINTAKNSAISTASSDATKKANNALASAKTDATTKANNALADAKTYTNGQITTVNQTINNKVAEIKTTTDSITQRVASAESTLQTTTTTANNALNNTDNIWSKDYSVNTATILPIKEFNGVANLNAKYWYEVEGFIDSTGTNNGAMVIFKGNGTSFELEKIFEKGTGSNHVKLFLDNGIPSVSLYNHTSKYLVRCRVKRMPRNVSTTSSLQRTKNQVATIETNLSSITSRVSSVENTTTTINKNITNLQSRMSTAESKITDTAITNTVKKNFYTKTETDSQITSKGYQTASQVQQTVDKLEVKFEESGGYNLIRNSAFKNGTDGWIAYANNASGTASMSVRNASASDEWVLNNRNSLEFRVTGLDSRYNREINCGFTYLSVDCVPNKQYTFACLLSAHRVQTLFIEIHEISKVDNSTVKVHQTTCTPKSGGKNRNNWNRIYFPFTISNSNTNRFAVRVFMNNWNDASSNSVYLWMTEAMVTVGGEDLPYTPNADELYAGITAIDKDGIKVTHSDGTYSKMGKDGFEWFNGQTGNKYHCLMYGGEYECSSQETRTVTLPAEFRGKPFKVISTIKRIRTIADIYVHQWPILTFHAITENINHANGTFNVYASVRALNYTKTNEGTWGALVGDGSQNSATEDASEKGHIKTTVAFWAFV